MSVDSVVGGAESNGSEARQEDEIGVCLHERVAD